MIKAKESEGKYSFGKNIIFSWDCTHNILISINILFALFSYFVLLILQDQNLRNLCVQLDLPIEVVFGMGSGQKMV